jgi:hypothetical protein
MVQKRKIAQGAGDEHRGRLAKPSRVPFWLGLFS